MGTLKDTTVNIKHETYISTFASIKCHSMFLTLLIPCLSWSLETMKDKRCGPVMKAIDLQVFTPMVFSATVWPLTGFDLRSQIEVQHSANSSHWVMASQSGLLTMHSNSKCLWRDNKYYIFKWQKLTFKFSLVVIFISKLHNYSWQ